MTGTLVLVVGPSGAGKDTLIAAAARALRDSERLRFPRRLVTRGASAHEDHDTIDEAGFAAGFEAGRFPLAWRAHGLGYALPERVHADLEAGRIVVANVSRSVVDAARARFPVCVVAVTAPRDVLAARLAARARPEDGDLQLRLARADAHIVRADHTIVNDGPVEVGAASLVAILTGLERGPARVVAVAGREGHHFSKVLLPSVELIAGEGVAGDAHRGTTVKHRSRVRADPTQPNLRQVHLLPSELLAEWAAAGIPVAPGAIGENLTTHGIDLMALPRGTRLQIGASALVEITGLRNPCAQIENFRPGLLALTLPRDAQGKPVLRAGIMGIVLAGGAIAPGDRIAVTLPELPHVALERV